MNNSKIKKGLSELGLISNSDDDDEQVSPSNANAIVIGSVICVVCGKDTGLSQIDLENCDPVCSEDCSNKRVKHFR